MRNSRTPPGPPGGFFLGHYPQFLRDKLGFLTQCAAEYGDVVKLKIRKPTFLLTNPDDIKHVLVTSSSNYDKTPRLSGKRAQRVLGEGLLTKSSGTMHLRQRRMLQPMFHRKSIEVFADVMVHTIQEMLDGWRIGTVVDIAHEMKNLAQLIMVRILFGNNSGDVTASLLKAISLRRRYYEHMLGSLFPFPEYLPARAVRDYPQAIQQIDDAIDRATQTRRNNSIPSDDMMSAFVHARYEDGTGMNDTQIRDEALTFMDTGYETTSAALAWTWYLLSQHPYAESKLLSELHRVLNGRPPCAEDVSKLVYGGMVLAESLRLYPPTWMFVRIARHEDTLPSGVTLPRASRLFLCQYVAHRHPHYFPEPERFDPERFKNLENTNRPRFAYFPFGGGLHACIGEPLARMEVIMVLATMAQRFKLELVPGQNIMPDPGLALRPKNGIRMQLSIPQ